MTSLLDIISTISLKKIQTYIDCKKNSEQMTNDENDTNGDENNCQIHFSMIVSCMSMGFGAMNTPKKECI